MIRLLGENDRQTVTELLGMESALNLFIIGDIENYGMATDFQQLWGDFDPTGRLRAVLLRYYGSLIPYAPGDFDADGLAEIIREHRDRVVVFSGIERVVARFDGLPGILPDDMERRALDFLELRDARWLDAELPPGLVRATVADVPAMLELWRNVEGFGLTEHSERLNRHELETGAGRALLVRDGGKVVATVKTSAENSRSAMIVGVATHPAYRGRGLASRLLSSLCRELLAEGKRPCLFYDDPTAGGIYRRLGFTDLGRWVMFEVTPT